MNICLLGQFPPHIGGVSSHTYSLARELVKRGDKVFVLTYPHPEIKNTDGITLVTPYTVNIKGLRGFIFFFTSLVKLHSMVKKKDIDIIHAHFILPPGLIAVLIGRLTGRKVVVTVHGSDIFILTRNPLLKVLIKYVLRKADIIGAVTSKIREKILDLDVEGVEDKIKLTPNAVDLNKFKPTNQSHFSDAITTKKPILLFVGNLVHQKGLPYLIEAKKNMEVSSALIIVGDGPLKKDLQARVKGEQIKDVFFTGARRDVEHLMPEADLFVLPSTSEGSPITLLEAFATGLPAVATDVGGIKELVTSDVGIVVVPRDPTALKEAMDKLLQDNELRHKMGQQAQLKARKYGDVIIPY